MKRVAKQRLGTTRVLTDPEPQFVSLVKAGANMTPFVSVKAEDDPAMKPRVRQRSAVEALTAAHPLTEEPTPAAVEPAAAEATEAAPDDAQSAIKAEGFTMTKIVFKGQKVTEGSVKSWLDDGGYVDVDVTAIEGGFEVTPKEAPEIEGETRDIELGDAVVTVGKLKVAEPTEEAAKNEPEGTSAVVTDVTVAVNPVAKSDEPAPAADAKPEDPAAEEPAAVETQKADAEVAKRSLGTVCSLTEVVRQLAWIAYDEEWYSDQTGEDSGATVAEIKQLSAQALTLLAKVAGDEASKLVTQKAEEAAARKAAAEAEKVAKAAENKPAPAVEVSAAEMVAKAMGEALAPLTAAMAEIAKSVTAQGEALQTVKAEIGERVGALENRSQTRKSADLDDVAASNSTTQPAKKDGDASAYISELATRSALGIPARKA